jgi:hypothetical protein
MNAQWINTIGLVADIIGVSLLSWGLFASKQKMLELGALPEHTAGARRASKRANRLAGMSLHKSQAMPCASNQGKRPLDAGDIEEAASRSRVRLGDHQTNSARPTDP